LQKRHSLFSRLLDKKSNNINIAKTKIMFAIKVLKSSQFFLLNSISKSVVQLSTLPPRDDLDDSLLFPENKHNRNNQADKISKAMVYYMEKLTARGKLTFYFQVKNHLRQLYFRWLLKFYPSKYRRNHKRKNRRVRNRQATFGQNDGRGS